MSLILEIGIKTWLFSLDCLALTSGIGVALLTGMTGSATPEYSIYDLLQKMKTDMNSLDTSWVSDSGNEIRSRFQLFSNRFETQKEVIDSYAGFLDLVVSTYDTNESTMSSNASGIQY